MYNPTKTKKVKKARSLQLHGQQQQHAFQWTMPGYVNDDEVHLVPGGKEGREDFKEAYTALKKAFEDLKEKYFISNDENSKLKRRLSRQNVTQLAGKGQGNGPFDELYALQIHKQANELQLALEQNQKLREKLSKSFTAFQEKYQECERLKIICQEYENKAKEEDATSIENTVSQTTQHNNQATASISFSKESSLKSVHTQTTSEEKPDDDDDDDDPKWASVLNYYGLELVNQKEELFLIITDRDVLADWITDHTCGKMRLTFDITPVREISVQTENRGDLDKGNQPNKELEQLCHSHEQKITLLKQKIFDQSKELKRLDGVIDKLHTTTHHHDVKDCKDAGTSTSDAANEENSQERRKKKLRQLIANISGIINETNRLQGLLAQQKNHISRLVEVINRTKKVRLDAMSRIAYQRSQDIAAIEKTSSASARTVDSANSVEQKIGAAVQNAYPNESEEADIADFLSIVPIDAPLSMPVQETDTRVQTKLSSAKELSNETSDNEDIEAATTTFPSQVVTSNDGSSARSYGLPLEVRLPPRPLVETRGSHRSRGLEISGSSVVSYEPGNATPRSDYPPPAARSPPCYVLDSSHDNDDIIVIQEESEIHGASGVSFQGPEMICPMCPIIFALNTTQNEFELHVEAHFNDS